MNNIAVVAMFGILKYVLYASVAGRWVFLSSSLQWDSFSRIDVHICACALYCRHYADRRCFGVRDSATGQYVWNK